MHAVRAGHTVTRHHDDRFPNAASRLPGRRRFGHLAGRCDTPAAGCTGFDAESAEDDVPDGPVHRPTQMNDRIAPDDPTSAPVMMSRSFESMKPTADAAHPE